MRSKTVRWFGTLLGLCAIIFGVTKYEKIAQYAAFHQTGRGSLAHVSDVLAAYGWTSQEEQNAFVRLCERAHVDLGTLNADLSPEETVSFILKLVSETQKKFRNRQQGQERWETSPLAWMEQNVSGTLSDLKDLGVQAAVSPAKNAHGVICILGAARERMASRLMFVHKLSKQGFKVDQVALISGARSVDSGPKKIDGTPDELSKVAQRRGRKNWSDLTEMDLLEDLYSQYPLLPDKPVVINAPSIVREGRVCRPTTQSTVALFLEWLKEHPEVKNVFFVSSQPHVLYQKAVIESVFATHPKMDVAVHVVGDATDADVKAQCEALGAYLWGRALLVIRDLGLKIPTELKDDFEKIFQDPTFRKLLMQVSDSK